MNKNAILLVAALFLGQFASADDLTPELRATTTEAMEQPHVGFYGGLGSPEGSLNPGGQYAIEYGFQPYVPFALSVELGYAYFTDDSFNFSRSTALLKGTYNFGGDIPVVKHGYVGVGVGAAWEDTTIDEELAAVVVPQAGFDFPLEQLLSAPLSLGVNASYLISSRGTPDVFTTSGVIKYWF